MAMKIDESNFEQETKEGLVLVDFYADWCAPCRALGAVLEKVEGVKVVKVDVDASQELGKKHNVSSIPKLIWFKEGIEVFSSMGVQSKAQIESKIKELNGE